MNRAAITRNLLALATVASIALACGPSDSSGLVGNSAPDVKLIAVSQKADVQLSKLKGKVVLLDFWATYCGPCRMLTPELERIQKKYRKDGLTVLGVSSEPQETVAAFQQANVGLVYDLFVDRDGSASTLYHAESIPTTVLIGKDGTVAYYSQGFSGPEVARLEETIAKELAKA